MVWFLAYDIIFIIYYTHQHHHGGGGTALLDGVAVKRSTCFFRCFAVMSRYSSITNNSSGTVDGLDGTTAVLLVCPPAGSGRLFVAYVND